RATRGVGVLDPGRVGRAIDDGSRGAALAPRAARSMDMFRGRGEGDAPHSTPAQEREAALDAGGFQAVFRIPSRVSVAAQEGAKSFRIATATIAPDLLARAA